MKLYILETKYEIGKISECEVLKETEKTYTVNINGWGKHLVRKSEMRVYKGLLFKTYDETITALKALLKRRIEEKHNTIKRANAEIEKYTFMLADIEKGGVE